MSDQEGNQEEDSPTIQERMKSTGIPENLYEFVSAKLWHTPLSVPIEGETSRHLNTFIAAKIDEYLCLNVLDDALFVTF